MELLADVLLNPQFAEPELARKTAEMKARLKRMEEEPRQIAQLAFSKAYSEAIPTPIRWKDRSPRWIS